MNYPLGGMDEWITTSPHPLSWNEVCTYRKQHQKKTNKQGNPRRAGVSVCALCFFLFIVFIFLGLLVQYFFMNSKKLQVRMRAEEGYMVCRSHAVGEKRGGFGGTRRLLSLQRRREEGKRLSERDKERRNNACLWWV